MRFLSDRKFYLPAIFILFALFTACTAGAPPTDVSEAVSQGLIMSIEAAENVPVRAIRRDIATARSGQLTDNIVIPVSLYFPLQQDLYFRNTTGEFTLLVENGQRVAEGDNLANLRLDNDRLEVNRIQTEIRIQQHDQNTANEAARRRTEINSARFYAEYASNDADLTRMLLHVAQLELAYDRFRFNAANTRRTLIRELEEIQERLAGEYLLAPFGGTVRNVITTIPYEFFENRQPRILILIDEDNLLFSITLSEGRQRQIAQTPVGVFSHGRILTIQSHHADYRGRPPTLSFEARIVTDLWGAGYRGDFIFLLAPVDKDGLLEALSEIDPYDPVHAFRSFNLQADVEFTVVDYGVLIPHQAVQTQDRLHFTFVYENGNQIRRFVNPGARAGNYIHIISGIDAGEQVVILP